MGKFEKDETRILEKDSTTNDINEVRNVIGISNEKVLHNDMKTNDNDDDATMMMNLMIMEDEDDEDVSMVDMVESRLRNVNRTHVATLAGLTSLNSSSRNTSAQYSSNNKGSAINSLAELAWRRSECSQPPLDDGHFGGGSAASVEEGIIMDIQLNPPERVAPHRLLLSHNNNNNNNNDDNSQRPNQPYHMAAMTMSRAFNEHNLLDHSLETIVKNTTLKAITALTALCEEAHELEETAFHEFLPQIVLFGADLQLDTFYKTQYFSNNRNQMDDIYNHSNYHHNSNASRMLNETETQKRDSLLLRRMGLFLPVLQTIQNFTLRCQRLLRNMVCQVGGAALPPNYNPPPTVSNSSLQQRETNHSTLNHDSGKTNGNDDTNNNNNTSSSLNESTQTSNIHTSNINITEDGFVLSTATNSSNSISLDDQINHKVNDDTNVSQNVNGIINNKDGAFGTKIALLPLGEAIAKTLKIIIAIDYAISSNNELQEAWELYKSVVSDKSKQMQSRRNQRLNKNKIHAFSNYLYPSNQRAKNASSNDKCIDDKEKENIILEKLMFFERMLIQLDITLLSSRCFSTAIEQNFDPGGYFYSRRQGELLPLHEEIKVLLTALFRKYCSRVNSDNEMDERKAIIGVYGMYCLYRRLLPSNLVPDAKLHKTLWTSFPSTCPIINIYGHLAFLPTAFLTKYAPLDRVRGIITDPIELKEEAVDLLNKRDKVFSLNVSKLHKEALTWIVTVDTDLSPSEEEPDEENGSLQYTNIVEEKTILLLKGLLIAQCASTMLSSYLIMHKTLEIPIPSDHIFAIIKLCTIIKSVEKMIRVRRKAAVISLHRAALKMVSSSIFRRFDRLRLLIDQHTGSIDHSFNTELNTKMSRINAYLSIIETILKGSSSFSPARRYVLELTLCVCTDVNENGGLVSEDGMACESLLRHLGMLSDIDQNFKNVCDCSFLYFHKELFPSLIEHLYESGKHEDMCHFHSIASAFSDSEKLLRKSASYYHKPSTFSKKIPEILRLYQTYLINETIHERFIKPLSLSIENDLRITIMSKNEEEINTKNPKKEKKENIGTFLEMTPIVLCGLKINIKSIIEKYLEKSFYDLSTISMHDAHLYQQMNIIAKGKYDLDMIDSMLPCGSSQQNIDIASILDDVNDFTLKFNYNMNQQIFIERNPKNGSKFLNTISIHSISTFLKQHGIGTIKHAMNQIYKVISDKFQVMSKLLVEDYLRSLISREQRWFDENKIEEKNIYTFDRALAFSKDVRKLNGIEYQFEGDCLDNCISAITTIGNALGLVRLLRSGELNHKSKSLQYITGMSSYRNHWSTQNDSSTNQFQFDSFQNFVNESSSSKELSKAIRNLDEVLVATLSGCSGGSDYLKILLRVFEEVLSGADNKHLNNFFLLIPAASLGWLDTTLGAKETKRVKSKNTEVYYVDDGFAMGVAFVLSILDQNEKFDNLGWFDELGKKFADDQMVLLTKKIDEESKVFASSSKKRSSFSFLKSSKSKRRESRGAGNDELEELSNINETEHHLQIQKYEMEVLFYSIKSARIFFRQRNKSSW